MIVATCLGETRETTVVDGADGLVALCPWCDNAAHAVEFVVRGDAVRCPNPACDANPWWDAVRLTGERERRQVAADAESARVRSHAISMERITWDRTVRNRLASLRMAHAKAVGACPHCANDAWARKVKIIRHRNGCPARRPERMAR